MIKSSLYFRCFFTGNILYFTYKYLQKRSCLDSINRLKLIIYTSCTSIKNGILEFKLHGHKLKGLFVLIHTNMDDQDKDWLLIKKDDVFAATHVYDAKIIPSYDEVFL